MLDILEPIFKSHRLVVDRQVILLDSVVQQETPQYSLVHQMTRMSRLKGALPNEDRLEALAMACGYWTQQMDRTADQRLKKVKDEALDAELRKFMKAAGARGPYGGGYLYAPRTRGH